MRCPIPDSGPIERAEFPSLADNWWLPAVPCAGMCSASETDRKQTMGSVADKIAKKVLSSRGSKVVDLASWREGRKMALDAGLGDEGPIPAKFADHDPCHGIYALA